VTIENEYDWYDSRVAKASPESVNFDMHERNGMRLIGNCSIFDIDRAAGTAECGILIGEKDCWHRGYGTETMVLLARYAFDTLALSQPHAARLRLQRARSGSVPHGRLSRSRAQAPHPPRRTAGR